MAPSPSFVQVMMNDGFHALVYTATGKSYFKAHFKGEGGGGGGVMPLSSSFVQVMMDDGFQALVYTATVP